MQTNHAKTISDLCMAHDEISRTVDHFRPLRGNNPDHHLNFSTIPHLFFQALLQGGLYEQRAANEKTQVGHLAMLQ